MPTGFLLIYLFIIAWNNNKVYHPNWAIIGNDKKSVWPRCPGLYVVRLVWTHEEASKASVHGLLSCSTKHRLDGCVTPKRSKPPTKAEKMPLNLEGKSYFYPDMF